MAAQITDFYGNKRNRGLKIQSLARANPLSNKNKNCQLADVCNMLVTQGLKQRNGKWIKNSFFFFSFLSNVLNKHSVKWCRLITIKVIAHFRITLHCRQTKASSRGPSAQKYNMYEKWAPSLDLKVLFFEQWSIIRKWAIILLSYQTTILNVTFKVPYNNSGSRNWQEREQRTPHHAPTVRLWCACFKTLHHAAAASGV